MTASSPALMGALVEQQRIDALRRLGVMDTAPEPLFDSITEAAASVCGTPIALVSLVDAERQWFKSNIGLAGVHETPRNVAFCDHAIRGGQLLEVTDATTDSRFAANPLVTGEPRIRFYAGAPIVLPGGEQIGTVCVIDRAPRQLDDTQRAMLANLARIAGHALAERARFVATSEALASSEARYRAIVEDQTELISTAELDGTLTFVNTAYARHHGRPAAELLGCNLLDLVDPADRVAVAAHLAHVCEATSAVVGVNRITSATGQSRWMSWSNRCVRDASGRPLAVQSVGRDITEQRLAEQALADSESRYRRLYEATPAALHSIDPQGRLVAVSDAWLQLLGYERTQVLGRSSLEFLTPESQRRAREEVLPAFFKTGRCDQVEYQTVRQDGALIDVLLSAIAEKEADGSTTRSLAIIEDITARKRIAAELGRTHAHLDAIVDNVPAMLGYWDSQGVTRFANREFQAAVGLPADQLTGSHLKAVFGAIDASVYALIATHVAGVLGGRRQEFQLAMLTTSGLRQLSATFVPDRSEPGRIAGFYGLWYDITGQKALELRRLDSEQRYRALFENLNSGFALHEVIFDAEGAPVDYTFLAMNPAFTAMTGIDASRAIGRRVSEVLPGTAADPANWVETFGQVARTGEPCHFEQRSAALDRWFEVVAYRPAPGQFAVLVQDITPRKTAAAAVAVGEQRLQLLVDAVHDHSMVLLDPQGHVQTWNVGAQRIKGYTAAEVIGAHYGLFFSPDDAAAGEPDKQLIEAAERGQVVTENWRYRKDGSRFWAAITLTAVRDEQLRLLGFVKIVQDLTERRRQQELIQRVAELSPSAMLLINDAGRIAFVNAQTEAMFGCPREQLIGEPGEKWLPGQLARRELLPGGSAAIPGVGPTVTDGLDFHASRSNGQTFEAELRVAHFDTAEGPARLVAVLDVTERRRQQARIEDALKEKETLLKEVYHRVKNNLQVVQSLLSLQRRTVADGAARTALENSVQRVRAMALVHEKLYQSGNLSVVSLADYTHDLLKQIGEASGAAQRHIRLDLDVAPLHTGLDGAIPFGLLVAELVGNALKHGFAARDSGQVHVTVTPHPLGAELRVTDDGVGLAESFDLAAPKSMGLQLAASLAGQLGGSLEAERGANGATFKAVLTRL